MQIARRKIAAGLVGLAALGGAGGAYAASGDGDGGREGARAADQAPPTMAEMKRGHDEFLKSVADELGVSVQELEDAFAKAHEERLAADVEAGRLTERQADHIREHTEGKGEGDVLIGPGPPLGPHPHMERRALPAPPPLR